MRRRLHTRSLEGSDAALERYWRERDVASLPLFYFARDMGALDDNNAFNRLFFERVCAQPAMSERLVDVVERRVSPYEAFGPGTMLRWIFGAMVRGRFDVLGPFLRAGQVGAQVAKEWKQAKQRAAGMRATPLAVGTT